MPRSMTAYARASRASPFGKLVMEVHSVNRRGLDLVFHLPREFLAFDVELRKLCASVLERGQLTIRLTLDVKSMEGAAPLIAQLQGVKRTWETVAEALEIDKREVQHLPFLVSQMQPVSFTFANAAEEKGMREVLNSLMSAALSDLVRMKEEEGAHLAKDLNERLKSIEQAVQQIGAKRDAHGERYRQKLLGRLQECGALNSEAEERIDREVVLLAEKMDITEELVRLNAHVQQMRARLSSNEKAMGKALDFLVQEMLRETHTLGVKAADASIAPSLIEMKSTLEKMREQVQNIE